MGKIQVQCIVSVLFPSILFCPKSAILCLHSFRLYAWDPQRICTMFLTAGDFIARWDRQFSPGIPMGISDFHGQLVPKPEF